MTSSLQMTNEDDLVNSEERGTILIGQHSKDFSQKPSMHNILMSPQTMRNSYQSNVKKIDATHGSSHI